MYVCIHMYTYIYKLEVKDVFVENKKEYLVYGENTIIEHVSDLFIVYGYPMY